MRKSLILSAAALTILPLTASAETWNLYGRQDHSYEFVEQSRPTFECLDENTASCSMIREFSISRDWSRIENNRSVIGFAASADTGMAGTQVNVQCENLLFVNEYSGGTGWCNRNSKFSLSSDSLGEIMFGTWLLPYNAVVAPKVDPFYDTGATAHSNIMGSVGGNTGFYNAGQFESSSTGNPPGEYNAGIAKRDQGFNRMQENIVQYFSPDINGVTFRLAMTAGNRDDTMAITDSNIDGTAGNSFTNVAGTFTDRVAEVDPRIYSSSLAYENGPLWLAATYQKHEDWAAANLTFPTGPSNDRINAAVMTGSDADSYRVAARYIFDLGEGASVQLAAMYEDLEYDLQGAIGIRAALQAFGFGHAEAHNAQGRGGAAALYGSRGIGRLVENEVEGGAIEVVRGIDVALSDSDNADVAFERSAWMLAGKVKFGGPVDVRFSYMDADDIDLRCSAAGDETTNCPATWDQSGADAWNIGLFYTMPAGTELRVTYSEINNDFNGTYGQSISGTGLGTPEVEIETLAVGLVHWFD